MKFIPVIITCPGREAMLEQTLASWRQTDFGKVEPLIQMDTNQHERKQERQEHNSLAALKLAIQTLAMNRTDLTAPEFILFMEDDIIFNRHLRHNLENWAPIRRHVANQEKIHTVQEEAFFASLYDCTIREIVRVPEENYFIADPDAVYGSQCYVVSVPLARCFVEHWWEVPGMQDIKMSRLAARLCPIHYHTPSMVQHVGYQSAWGGRFHDTQDFDGDFRRGTCH